MASDAKARANVARRLVTLAFAEAANAKWMGSRAARRANVAPWNARWDCAAMARVCPQGRPAMIRGNVVWASPATVNNAEPRPWIPATARWTPVERLAASASSGAAATRPRRACSIPSVLRAWRATNAARLEEPILICVRRNAAPVRTVSCGRVASPTTARRRAFESAVSH